MNIQANKAMQSSIPIIRPMWMLNPKSQLSLSIDDQFFVGDTVRIEVFHMNFSMLKCKISRNEKS